jgi:ABC-2 type transport system permease protein
VLLQASAFGWRVHGLRDRLGLRVGLRAADDARRANRLGILAGYALAALARAAIVGVLLFAVALVVGMQVDGGGRSACSA